MITVSGVDDRGVPYQVGIHPAPPDDPAATGCVMGSTGIRALLLAYRGQQVMVTPTGPAVTVDPDDPASALAALYALTTVTAVDGDDIPDVIPADEGDGTVY